MDQLKSTLLWLPSSALQDKDEFFYWADAIMAANAAMQALNEGEIQLEEAIELCKSQSVDVDDVLKNLDEELTYLGF